MLRPLTWLLSFGFHAGIAFLLLAAAGGAAFEQGNGADTMVVEQGIALEGVAKLGEDMATIEPVEAITTPDSQATPQPEEVKPVELSDVIRSESGPDQESVQDPVPEVKETLPPQIAMVQQEAAIEAHESSGQQQSGGDTNAKLAYLGALRAHLERTKINPRSSVVGTAVVHFVVDPSGRVISREISVSSGSKILDDAAIASIDKASPFPAMPQTLQRDAMDVSVPFKFSVR
jgi:periplasmic protein TonB